jgi:hypothetical protein
MKALVGCHKIKPVVQTAPLEKVREGLKRSSDVLDNDRAALGRLVRRNVPKDGHGSLCPLSHLLKDGRDIEQFEPRRGVVQTLSNPQQPCDLFPIELYRPALCHFISIRHAQPRANVTLRCMIVGNRAGLWRYVGG